MSSDVKLRFVNYFGAVLKKYKDKFKLEDKDISYPKEPDKFFKFWESQFHTNAEITKNKIINMAANIKDIEIKGEEDLQLNEYAFKAVYGINPLEFS